MKACVVLQISLLTLLRRAIPIILQFYSDLVRPRFIHIVHRVINDLVEADEIVGDPPSCIGITATASKVVENLIEEVSRPLLVTAARSCSRLSGCRMTSSIYALKAYKVESLVQILISKMTKRFVSLWLGQHVSPFLKAVSWKYMHGGEYHAYNPDVIQTYSKGADGLYRLPKVR